MEKCEKERGTWPDVKYLSNIILKAGGTTCRPYVLRMVISQEKQALSVVAAEARKSYKTVCGVLFGCYEILLFG